MMNIIIDGNSASQNKSGKIMGNIYFDVDGQFYPEKNWSDFLQIVLGWWVNDFIISQKRVNENFEFRFMDGPYKVLGQSSEADIYQVQFMRDALDKDEILLTTVTTKIELQKTLLKACETFFRIVEQQNISHEKIYGLKVLFDQLKDV